MLQASAKSVGVRPETKGVALGEKIGMLAITEMESPAPRTPLPLVEKENVALLEARPSPVESTDTENNESSVPDTL
jgi:hypothetical protein